MSGKAFECALQAELQETVEEFKSRAARVKEAGAIWEMEHRLAERRKEIDRKYDYRYLVLPMVFGRLINEGRIQAANCEGCVRTNWELIRRITAF